MTMLRIATSDGLHVHGGEDAVELEGHEVRALARDADAWWAVVDGHEIWVTTEGDWQKVSSASARLNCLSTRGTEVLVGAADARLFSVVGSGLVPVESFDRVRQRAEWYTPWGGPPDVRSIARADGAVFVNVHVGGILRSLDGGVTWDPTLDISSDVHEVVATDGLLLAASAWGLGTSRDAGESWEFTDDGLHSSYARAVARAGDSIVMSAATGPFGGRAALYRRPVTGGSFEKCAAGLPEWFADNIDTGCIAADGARVAFATAEGDVFLSENEGATWEQVAKGLGVSRWIVFD